MLLENIIKMIKLFGTPVTKLQQDVARMMNVVLHSKTHICREALWQDHRKYLLDGRKD